MQPNTAHLSENAFGAMYLLFSCGTSMHQYVVHLQLDMNFMYTILTFYQIVCGHNDLFCSNHSYTYASSKQTAKT